MRASDRADALSACEGAREAIAFLKTQGLSLVSDVTVEVSPRLSNHVHASAAGCYLEPQRRVVVLAYSALEKQKSWFKVPVDRRLYRSLVAHEVAHAVAACNFRIPAPTIAAKEYIAYVAMLSTMDPLQRDAVLAQYPGEGYEGDWQMSTTIYLLDPMRFGVQAYRHFLRPANGRDYLHSILDGKVLTDGA